MKRFWRIVSKSLREQIRNYWIMILGVSMAPFFVAIYFLIIEASKPHYDILILNKDKGAVDFFGPVNYGRILCDSAVHFSMDTMSIPLSIKTANDHQQALDQLRSKQSDALIILPENFSQELIKLRYDLNAPPVKIELVGDLTDMYYMVSAIWAGEIMNAFICESSGRPYPIEVTETSLGISGTMSDFDMVVPGLLILSVIMLMFSATIAFVAEVENKTIIRLKLSKLKTIEFLSGVSVIQILLGVVSILLTLATAILLGFHFAGSIWTVLLVAILTSISIIAFSLILGAATKTVNEILVLGNFPLFLFMFFTGAAFPIEGKPMFFLMGYPVSIQGFMSPTHAISALKKVMILNMEFRDILPEIFAILILTVIYFAIGLFAFGKRHMQLK
ncbi:MAG: ABC transporter permease [Bacteroidales bacterium]|nr:ABC transporter permease [Bacteroidales bacterium]